MRCNGQRIKALRLMRGLTLKDVSLALGVQEATVQRYESGKIRDIPDDRVHDLAETLGTSTEYLMGIGDIADNKSPEQGVEWLLAPTKLAGENIKKRRKTLRLTVDELADKVQVSRQTIYRYESGQLGKISPKTKRRLADALQTSVAYVIGKTTDPFDISPSIQTLEALTDAQSHQIDKDNEESSAVSKEIKDLVKTVMELCMGQDSTEGVSERINFVAQFIKSNETVLKTAMDHSSDNKSDETD